MARVYTVEEIRNKVQTDKQWALRAVLAIHKKQTAGEQASKCTYTANNVGFNKPDASVLSAIVQKLRAGTLLQDADYDQCFRRMPKYAGQLKKIADGEI